MQAERTSWGLRSSDQKSKRRFHKGSTSILTWAEDFGGFFFPGFPEWFSYGLLHFHSHLGNVEQLGFFSDFVGVFFVDVSSFFPGISYGFPMVYFTSILTSQLPQLRVCGSKFLESSQ